MKRALSRFFAYAIVIIMIALSTGFAVYSHYCTCTSNQQLSIIVYQGCSDQHCNDFTLHKADVSCCSPAETPDNTVHGRCLADDCCITEVKVVQFTTEYQPSTMRLLPMPWQPLIYQPFVLPFVVDLQPRETYSIAQSYSPPLNSGRELLISLHQLRIPEPVC